MEYREISPIIIGTLRLQAELGAYLSVMDKDKEFETFEMFQNKFIELIMTFELNIIVTPYDFHILSFNLTTENFPL